MDTPFSLAGKTIFITGASSGIGKAIATECSKMGAKLIITGRNKGRLDDTLVNLAGTGHSGIVADLTEEDEIKKISEEVGLLDGIVHSAGIYKLVPVSFINEEAVKEVIGTNFMAPLALTSQLLKAKKVNKNASIVFISSIAGSLVSSPGGSLYSASKGALNGLIKGMALDLAPRGIRVNGVAPGTIQTTIFEGSAVSREQLNEDIKKYPLRRYGKPEEVAYSVIYLLSDASAWVTGSSLVIDGGFTLL